jgi:threonine/homoserine/homoserine lactone efflux protein
MAIVDDRFIRWLMVATVIILAPGPDFALVTRSVLSNGVRSGSLVTIGVALGTLAWAVLSALGVAVVIAGSPLALDGLRVGGALYLVFLGARALLTALAPTNSRGARRLVSRSASGDVAAFTQGLVSNLLNPKIGVFFLAVLPQFAAPTDPPGRVVALVGVYLAILFAWLLGYASVLGRASAWLGHRPLALWLERLTGVSLMAIGLELLATRT